MVVAVDFDGTLFTEVEEGVGQPITTIIRFCKELKLNGNKLILWTCREGQELLEAIDACNEVGLTFDAVNDNLPERKELVNGNVINSRKIRADMYIDNKGVSAYAVYMAQITPPNKPIEKKK